jgi:hypothetical protein
MITTVVVSGDILWCSAIKYIKTKAKCRTKEAVGCQSRSRPTLRNEQKGAERWEDAVGCKVDVPRLAPDRIRNDSIQSGTG